MQFATLSSIIPSGFQRRKICHLKTTPRKQ
nr:MAG TPA: hypothetical protein [Caudoviricetes sp.]